MPIYGILKRFLGEYVDFLVFIIIFLLYYFDMINWQLLQGSVKILIFFYLYKVYHIIFVRQYDNSKFYAFTWDFERIFSEKFLKKYNRYIYILFILMPWNLYWYIIVNFIVGKKLMKVWFNGNKDIFFKKYFDVDIRLPFDVYIQWYYTYIDKYVRIFIHEPILRMIIVPTLIRSALIYSSFFGIFKARMFMFLFVSFLAFSGINVYFHELSIWIICIIVYVYFLVIWPIIIKMFNIEYINYLGHKVKYTTPQNIFAACVLVEINSVSLNCLLIFMSYLNIYNIDKYLSNFRFYIYPSWHRNFLINENKNNIGDIDYANGDRKFCALLFWRYEKTYSSFYCFNCYFEGEIRYILLFLHFIHEQFNVSYFTEGQLKEINEICTIIYKMYIFGAADALIYLINENQPLYLDVLFYDNVKYEEAKTKSHSIVIHYSKYYKNTAHKDIPLKFEYINEYIDRIKVASFFVKCNYIFLNPLLSEYWKFLSTFFLETNEVIKREGKIIFSKNLFLNENSYDLGVNIHDNKELNGYNSQLYISFLEEYEKIYNKQPQKFVNYKKILVLFKNICK